MSGLRSDGQQELVSYSGLPESLEILSSRIVVDKTDQALSPDGERVAFSVLKTGTHTSKVTVARADDLSTVEDSISIAGEVWIGVTWLDPDVVLLRCDSGRLLVWRVGRGKPIQFHEFDSTCTWIALDTTGEWLAASSEGDKGEQGEVALWRRADGSADPGNPLGGYRLYNSFPTEEYTWRVSLAGSASGDLTVVTVGWQQTISLWDPHTGKGLGQMVGHRNSIYNCQMLDDNLLVTSSKDQTVRIWDVAQREEVCTLYKGTELQHAPSISISNGRIAMVLGNKIEVVDSRDLQAYLDRNKDFERQRLGLRVQSP